MSRLHIIVPLVICSFSSIKAQQHLISKAQSWGREDLSRGVVEFGMKRQEQRLNLHKASEDRASTWTSR
jgi:hypothetical protein